MKVPSKVKVDASLKFQISSKNSFGLKYQSIENMNAQKAEIEEKNEKGTEQYEDLRKEKLKMLLNQDKHRNFQHLRPKTKKQL